VSVQGALPALPTPHQNPPHPNGASL
jgi:hypothetical protein